MNGLFTSPSALVALPYDVLLAVSQHLSYDGVQALRATCTALRDFGASRPVCRALVAGALRRCRPLPVPGFARLHELPAGALVRVLARGAALERGWAGAGSGPGARAPALRGHRVMRAPPGADVDWLSPIASAFVLCATRVGRVLCWDVERDACVAEWTPARALELWKCRVEFDKREVYFTMADVLAGAKYEEREMEFTVMRLRFPRAPAGATDAWGTPEFAPLARFTTHGAVMNVFLLDPAARVLAAYIWLAGSKTIGLYVLPDWDVPAYALVDTTLPCTQTGNWSCILHGDALVIHAEDTDHACQHFYPLALLAEHLRPIPEHVPEAPPFRPVLTARMPPPRTLRRRFIFPHSLPGSHDVVDGAAGAGAVDGGAHPPAPLYGHPAGAGALRPAGDPANPFRWPAWYPDSCHFVRQWWPAPAGGSARRVSCTVVLLAHHDPSVHRNAYVLAQHYFGTPLAPDAPARAPEQLARAPDAQPEWRVRVDGGGRASTPARAPRAELPYTAPEPAGVPLRLWYASTPFEIVTVADRGAADEDDEDDFTRERPLLAVDFGHAVWVEYVPEDALEEADVAARLRPAATSSADGADGADNDAEPDVDADADGDFASDAASVGHTAVADADAGDGQDDADVPPPRRPRRLRFTAFPPIDADAPEHGPEPYPCEASVRTLAVPADLDLEEVETINMDQSQGAVFVSVRDGSIFVLYYE